eukprot:8917283-Alexandrium_andersonii.AAC.1
MQPAHACSALGRSGNLPPPSRRPHTSSLTSCGATPAASRPSDLPSPPTDVRLGGALAAPKRK